MLAIPFVRLVMAPDHRRFMVGAMFHVGCRFTAPNNRTIVSGGKVLA
jgi:hypothetical protein